MTPLHATRAAVEEGIVAGGGVAYLRARANLKNLKGANPDQDAGIKIVLRALEEPMRQIVANTGDEPSVVVNKVVEGKGNFGFNAQTSEYGDLVEMGVIDPTKVARFALQNAASVAGLMLTTDAMVAELPKDDKGGRGDMASWHGRHGRYGYVTPQVNRNGIVRRFQCMPDSCERAMSVVDQDHSSHPPLIRARRLLATRAGPWPNLGFRRPASVAAACGRRNV